jgi:hypothetical protein
VKSLSFRSGLALENTKVISSGRRRLRGGWWLVFARVQILVCPSPPPHAASIRACPITSSPIVKLASMHWHFGNKALLQLGKWMEDWDSLVGIVFVVVVVTWQWFSLCPTVLG